MARGGSTEVAEPTSVARQDGRSVPPAAARPEVSATCLDVSSTLTTWKMAMVKEEN